MGAIQPRKAHALETEESVALMRRSYYPLSSLLVSSSIGWRYTRRRSFFTLFVRH